MQPWATALEVGAFGAFALVSIALAVVDVRTHRLPDRVVLPMYPVAVVMLGAAALVRGQPERLVPLVGGAVTLFAFYLALRMVNPGAMGGGDVKLAGVIGAYLGYLGWDAVLLGALAGFVFGGLHALFLIVRRRTGRGRRLAFGPWMLLGCWTAIAVHAASAGR